jgi:S-adenosylmethionine-dependent methyltransferase
MTTSDAFDSKAEAYKDHQKAPWTKLRYRLVLDNLRRHLPGGSLSVLDAGGGNGVEAVALAGLGCRVDLLDFSAEMLSEARRTAGAAGLEQAVRCRQGDVASVPRLFPAETFDAVLCHNVLQYVEDPDAVLRGLVGVLKPEGILSIICVNRYSEVYRLALRERDLPAARAALDEHVIVSKVIGEPMQAFAADELIAPIEQAGCSVIAEYGVRCINDFFIDDEPKRDPRFFAEMEKLERGMSARFPYRLLARSFQIVARKDPPQRETRGRRKGKPGKKI